MPQKLRDSEFSPDDEPDVTAKPGDVPTPRWLRLREAEAARLREDPIRWRRHRPQKTL